RRDHLTADQIVIDKLKAYENVDYLFEHIVTEIRGDQHVSSVMVQNRQTGDVHEMMTDGIFVQIGLIPNSAFAKNVLDMNEYNEIVIDESCRTSEPGIFAAGDVTTTRYKQIIIASGEGATAALSAADFLLNQPS
ncbi:MAG: alkyl hydroperoxide reductase subunit F, partial [Clostridia bacterium]|nr:alkyl hydroperoxide reductase subunit F [Clostridia bacterium]